MKKNLGTTLFMLAVMTTATTAHAEHLPTVSNPLWQQECGSCHIAYPPALLSATSWNAVMDGLSHHFGSDASLDAETTQAIRRFLVSNAGKRSSERQGKPLLRITETKWFIHEHSEDLPAGIWQSPAVKSASNCGACHTRAAQGRFSEHEIRLPKGASR